MIWKVPAAPGAPLVGRAVPSVYIKYDDSIGLAFALGCSSAWEVVDWG